ncbi:OsmC family protein [Fulvivirgaceae bacterium LMO-SS25]
MITIQSKYLGGLRTQATHVKSGNQLITDAPVDNNGKGEAFSPTDTVCAALGSCMMTIMGIMAERKGVNMEDMTMDITKEMSATPRKISRIIVDFNWPNAPKEEVEREKFRKAALTCPVALSLDPAIEQIVNFNF